ncbi:hypothetical protein SmJEL517_g05393 [Synchytrium microbalum]|uniref:ER membrane protein complex subunit 3 n=1 Tax=Synchytrium microbalum TaxID=1806994 RepID=A0A507BWK4_9FUNG|nr:uncharacterized protein SmJEL517_g05393 [Synchytrium microbalum]TPX31269.1 hypothetical protein SmJEL517_g05393 [Synchytrium microbalum]
MIMVGILRHHATQLMNSTPKTSVRGIRETQALLRSSLLRSPAASDIPPHSFKSRKDYWANAFEGKSYLKNPNADLAAQPNPMDPNSMDAMMDGMKKQMTMMVPQAVIMSWITFFFSGFVLIKLPFPLTVRFKSMLQRGIETADMDVSWVSSLSWYFLNLFGLRSIYTLVLGEENAADGLKDSLPGQMQMSQQNPMQQPSEVVKMFKSEKEYLDLAQHAWELEKVEDRLLSKYRKPAAQGLKKMS